MTDAQRAVREHRAADSFVIVSQESGYRVYAASDPSQIYEIREENGRWCCTCPDFDYYNQDADWNCEHILAAAPWAANAARQGRTNGHPVAMPPTAAAAGPDAQPPAAFMLIRRSVSPDGRIDSASVEFTLPVAGDSNGAIKEKALRTLGLQREIVAHFLGGAEKNGNGHAAPEPHENGHRSNGQHPNGNGTTSARIIEVGEVQGKWGPRLCLTFQVNGNRAKLFGSAKQLAARLGDAGFDYNPAALHTGLRLNLDCLVTTQPSDDGKYVNVDKVYPLPRNGGGR